MGWRLIYRSLTNQKRGEWGVVHVQANRGEWGVVPDGVRGSDGEGVEMVRRSHGSCGRVLACTSTSRSMPGSEPMLRRVSRLTPPVGPRRPPNWGRESGGEGERGGV